MRPERLDLSKPTGEFTTEESVGRVSARPELVDEPAWRVSQRGHDLALYRNAMLVDFIVKGLAENGAILVVR